MNTREFAEQHAVTVTSRPVAQNLNMLDPEWVARHYTVTLRHAGRKLTTSFSKGMALPAGVEVGEVLDALASDAASYENASSYEDWAGDFGLPTAPPEGVHSISRARDYGVEKEWDAYQRGKRTFRMTETNSEHLKHLLGDALYQKLLFDTERL